MGSKVLAERSWSAQCDATIAAACRVKSGGCNVRTARCPPHRWWTLSTDGGARADCVRADYVRADYVR